MGLPAINISGSQLNVSQPVSGSHRGISVAPMRGSVGGAVNTRGLQDLGDGIFSLGKSIAEFAANRRKKQLTDAMTSAKMAYQDADLSAEKGKELKLSTIPYYSLKGTAAIGAADKWREAAVADMQKRGKDMDPAVRKEFERQMAPFMAGQYANLKRHEMGEARSGMREETDAQIEKLGNDLAGGIAEQVKNISAEHVADISRIKGLKGELMKMGSDMATTDKQRAEDEQKVDKMIADEVAQRNTQYGMELHDKLMETVAQIDMAAGVIDSGTKDTGYGAIYSPIEATVKKQVAARGAYSKVVLSMAQAGNYDEAEAFVGALTNEDPNVPKESNTIAKRYGYDNAEIAKLAAGVGKIRQVQTKARFDTFDTKMADDTEPAGWVAAYRAAGEDENLKKTDPKRAKEYAEQANYLERLQKVGIATPVQYKPDGKQLTDNICDAILYFEQLQDPSQNIDSGLTDEQRKAQMDKYQNHIAKTLQAARVSQAIDGEDWQKLHKRFRTALTSEQRTAMGYLYRALGVDPATLRLDAAGGLIEAERKRVEGGGLQFYAAGHEGKRTRISGSDFMKMHDMVLSKLNVAGDTIDRNEMIHKVVDEVAAKYLETEDDKRLQMVADALMKNEMEQRAEVED